MPKYRPVAQMRNAVRKSGKAYWLVYHSDTDANDSRHCLQGDAVERMYSLNDATEARPWRVAFSPYA